MSYSRLMQELIVVEDGKLNLDEIIEFLISYDDAANSSLVPFKFIWDVKIFNCFDNERLILSGQFWHYHHFNVLSEVSPEMIESSVTHSFNQAKTAIEADLRHEGIRHQIKTPGQEQLCRYTTALQRIIENKVK